MKHLNLQLMMEPGALGPVPPLVSTLQTVSSLDYGKHCRLTKCNALNMLEVFERKVLRTIYGGVRSVQNEWRRHMSDDCRTD